MRPPSGTSTKAIGGAKSASARALLAGIQTTRRNHETPRDQRQIPDGDEQQSPLGAERRGDQHAEDRRRSRRAERVHAERAPESDARCGVGAAGEVAEQRAHDDRRRAEGEERRHGLGHDGRGHAAAETVDRYRLRALGGPQARRAEEASRGERSDERESPSASWSGRASNQRW